MSDKYRYSVISVSKRGALFKIDQRVRKVTAGAPLGKIVPVESVDVDEIERVMSLHNKRKAAFVPVEWDGGTPTLELVSLIRDYSVKIGVRVFHNSGETLRYGKVIPRTDALTAHKAVRYRDGEWAFVQWDDGEKQAVIKSELTPIVM